MEFESPRSPKRRRILASINPPVGDVYGDKDTSETHRPVCKVSRDAFDPRSDEEGDVPTPPEQREQEDTENAAPRPTKFRFKSKTSRSSSRRHREDHDGEDEIDRRRRRHHRREISRDMEGDGDSKDRGDTSKRRRRRHHHHHHQRRRRRSPSPPPNDNNNDPFSDPPLDPETAFRESLFDALADDEGAAYWESVYGQPIHVYPAPSASSSGGHLERMNDEEYAAYVRQKMWEKTHAGLLEARARREKEREEERRRREEAERIAREMERSLRRGEERRRRKGWREKWERYVEIWAEWDAAGKEGGAVTAEGIPWPGEDRTPEGVRAFFVHGLGLEEVGEKEFAARLKEERVRWHPDKMQQRLGGKVDEEVMKQVTGIFQVVDALWNDTRKNGG
ncbi:NF-kappa-B inhibitor-like protein 1 [Madurella mycetomatis]|uniref:NF-kappa-B inhibitor-like protein 1 n=1 Tax=Madurella mycetomatis TaxID=100816 RepID=A0A175VVA9_9PEZI|nr:NF-kappa-B inhibitor-like protein 1 [Madurella mycetomatis]